MYNTIDYLITTVSEICYFIYAYINNVMFEGLVFLKVSYDNCFINWNTYVYTFLNYFIIIVKDCLNGNNIYFIFIFIKFYTVLVVRLNI
jgi:hypothetical protein